MAKFAREKLVGALVIAALFSACDDDGASPAQEGDQGVRDSGAGGAGGGAGGAGGGGPDMAVVTPDAALPDAAQPDPDMAVVEPDAAGPDPDQGVPADMGPPAMGDVHGGRIRTLAIADNPAGQGCRDLNGDGTADNSLSLAAALANGALQQGLDDGSLNLLPTSIGLAAPGADGVFDLALLTGEPGGAGYVVSASALNPDGTARVIFGGTRVAGGQLSAGPGNFPVSIPVGGMELELNITDATIVGQAGIDANGFFVNGGVISGIIPHDALVAALQNTDFAFAAGLLPADIDGTGNSVCLLFTSEGVTLEGFPVE
jgi:hypothetical protein